MISVLLIVKNRYWGDKDMLIRLANMDDIEQLRHLYSELEIDAVKYQPEHFVVGYRNNDFFNSIFESSNQDILVADVDGTVIGFSHVMILKQKNIACLKPQTAVYIQDMVVLECERSKGIGTLLIDASKEYGKRRGADFIRTEVFPKNIDGMRFYERSGFSEMMKTIECQL
ncbi:MAG: GNAT family N-acetyltransferase [Lachnospiraceae bacterium]|nr:GNAT family N-acetyltransferase [Lachnospiraceae bacterium]